MTNRLGRFPCADVMEDVETGRPGWLPKLNAVGSIPIARSNPFPFQ